MEIKFENNNKNIQLDIEIMDDDIIKEYYIYTKNIRMFTFSKINYNWIKNNINNNNCLIYFLINDHENSIYIEETKNIISSLKKYENNKTFTKIILLISNDWNQVTIDYLAYWFIIFFKNKQIFKFNKIEAKSETRYNHSDKQIIDDSLNIIKWLLAAENIRIDNKNLYIKSLKHNNTIGISDNNAIIDLDSNKKKSREYLLSEDFNPTNSLPKYIKIFQKIIKINSWKGIWKYTIEKLYSINKQELIKLSYDKWPSKKNINISNKKEKDFATKNYELIGNQIYIATNFSALNCLKMTKLILEYFNIELNDISIYVEWTK